MKPTELRIGNIITPKEDLLNSEGTLIYQKKGAEYQVCLIDVDGLTGITEIGGWPMDKFEPIPLTEEWLVKFGLMKKYTDSPDDLDEKGNRWYYWVKGAFNLEIQTNGEIWFELYSHYIHVKYVHQLQNLYFALTGEELTLSK